jgi:hypothetical protein
MQARDIAGSTPVCLLVLSIPCYSVPYQCLRLSSYIFQSGSNPLYDNSASCVGVGLACVLVILMNITVNCSYAPRISTFKRVDCGVI